MSTPLRLTSVNVARAADVRINGRKVRSAIGKRSIDGPVRVTLSGLEGDEQADLSLHGGPSKAVYAYPSEHYAFWQTVRAQAKVTLWDAAPPPGLLGENLTLSGLLEADVWVGDLLRFKECTLAVSEPRYPCSKFNAAMGFSQATQLMADSAWCGFYLAVRMPGTIQAGDSFELEPGPRQVSIQEIFRSRMKKTRRPPP